MVKMVNLRRTKTEKKAVSKAMGEAVPAQADEGDMRVHLDHHHLTKMGMDGALKSGDKVRMHGEGTVESSSTRSEGGEDRHSATLRLHRGGVEQYDDGERDAKNRGDIRGDLEAAHGAAEKAKGK